MKDIIRVFKLKHLLQKHSIVPKIIIWIWTVLIIQFLVMKTFVLIFDESNQIQMLCDMLIIVYCWLMYQTSGFFIGIPAKEKMVEKFIEKAYFMPVRKNDIVRAGMFIFNSMMGVSFLNIIVFKLIFGEAYTSFTYSAIVQLIMIIFTSVTISKSTYTKKLKIGTPYKWADIGSVLLLVISIVFIELFNRFFGDTFYAGILTNDILGIVVLVITFVYLVLFTLYINNKCKNNDITL